MIKLSVIIVTYNSRKYIQGCIDSILRYNDLSDEELEIIVIDNSKDEESLVLKALISDLYGTKVQFIKNSVNGGYGQGNNLGVDVAKGDIITIVNPDVNLVKPVFSSVFSLFCKNKNLAMVGGKQFGGGNISYNIRPEFGHYLLMPLFNIVLNKVNIYLEKFHFLSGAMLFLDRKKFLEIGKFDENLFLFAEESDITNRFLQKGYRTCYRRDMVYRHLIEDRETVSEYSVLQMLVSFQKYFKKHNFNFEFYITKKVANFVLLVSLFKILGYKYLIEKNQEYIRIFKKFKNEYIDSGS